VSPKSCSACNADGHHLGSVGGRSGLWGGVLLLWRAPASRGGRAHHPLPAPQPHQGQASHEVSPACPLLPEAGLERAAPPWVARPAASWIAEATC